MDIQHAPYHEHDLGGPETQRRGFHTFVMTGDAIIRTNFNPFKPTRQLSYDHELPKPKAPSTTRSVSNQETSRTDSGLENIDRESSTTVEVDIEQPITPNRTCKQNKEFIPGFIRVDDDPNALQSCGKHPNYRPKSLNHTEDSGIDVQLSDHETGLDKQTAGTLPRDSQTEKTAVKDSEESGDTHAAAIDNIDELTSKQLATRLYQLDGYQLSDVCSYLSKSDAYHNQVAEEFLSFFDFTGHSIVESLRSFLTQVCLQGRIEEREKVLEHFTTRYLQCNPQQSQQSATFLSNDSCHTLVCALILLNDDLHNSQLQGKDKTTLKLFTESLSRLNNGQDFPKELLEDCYQSIECESIKASEEELKRRFSESIDFGMEPLPLSEQSSRNLNTQISTRSHNPSSFTTVGQIGQTFEEELPSGYVLVKHCKGSKGIKMPSRKRGWKRYYARIQDMKLLLFKSERSAPTETAASRHIELDNLYCAEATHYKKRKHGLSVMCNDGSEFIIIAGEKVDMDRWIHSINLVAAIFSKPEEVRYRFWKPMRNNEQPLGSLERTREQVEHYETQVKDMGTLLLTNETLPRNGATKQSLQDISIKQMKQQFQIQKYSAYVSVLKSRIEKILSQSQQSQLHQRVKSSARYSAGAGIEILTPSNRISYKQAVYGHEYLHQSS